MNPAKYVDGLTYLFLSAGKRRFYRRKDENQAGMQSTAERSSVMSNGLANMTCTSIRS